MKSKQMRALAKEECEMQMTPMIDVVFLLLIFFMCTLKFKTLEGKLSAYLPADVGVNPFDADPIEKVEILVRVTSPGNKLRPDGTKYTNDDEAQRKRFIYDDSRELEYSVGPRKIRDIEELARRLLEIHEDRVAMGQSEVPVSIDPRLGTVYSDIVKVLDAAIEANFKDITFVGAYHDRIE